MHAELDHIFLFVSNETTARKMMKAANLRVNYSRVHPGQGTRNLCACLDDVFLELLWLDGTEISAESERITLGARGRSVGSPIGVSWRGVGPFEENLSYAAPFLPNGLTIPVARASLDPELPFVFRTPGGTPPIQRTDGLVGERQTPELATLKVCVVSVPNPKIVMPLLSPFEKISVCKGLPGLRFTLLDIRGEVKRSFEWMAS
jgi:hypothetical protein